MSKQVLEAAFERRAAVDASDRLSRPWAVVLAGCMVSIAVAVLILAKSPDNGFAGALLTAFAGCFLTLIYVVVGRRYSKELAQRWTGAAGLLVALAGVAYLYYEMLWKPYP